MLRADEEHVVGRSLPHGPQQPGDELDEAARLLELLVLLEQGDDVLELRVERIGMGDLVGDGLRSATGGLGLGRLLQLASVGGGDVPDDRLVGKGSEQPLAQDVVNLAGGQVDRRDGPLLASKLGTRIVKRPVDDGRAAGIRGRKVGDDNAHVASSCRRQ